METSFRSKGSNYYPWISEAFDDEATEADLVEYGVERRVDSASLVDPATGGGVEAEFVIQGNAHGVPATGWGDMCCT